MDEEVANFAAITGATNNEAIASFLGRFENNVEMAIENFFEMPEDDEMRLNLFEDGDRGGIGSDNDGNGGFDADLHENGMVEGGGMVEEEVPKKSCSLVEISVLRGQWKMLRGQEQMVAGSALACNWRLHLSFNEWQFVTRPQEGSSNMLINEFFVSALRSSLVGILLVELRNLLDVTLAMGGLEISAREKERFSAPEGISLRMSGPVVEGCVFLRVVVREGVEPPPPPASPSRKRPKKLQRARSTGDIVDGTHLLPPTPEQAEARSRVEPLAVQCVECRQEKKYDAIVGLECGHTAQACRRCFRERVLRMVEAKTPDLLVCTVGGLACGAAYSEADLFLVLSGKEMERYHEVQLEKFLEQDDRIIRCPNVDCGCAMETTLALSRDLDQAANGPDGAPLQGEHLRHYNEFRYRCPKCGDDFCSSCLAMPYHSAYTCDEFRAFQKAEHCRFCKAALPPSAKGDVCTDAECHTKQASACVKKLGCGHKCGGVKGEKECPPCLHEDCDVPAASFHGSDFCSICWVEDLQSAPCVLLECGHMYHHACVVQKIEGKWPGLRITFGYLDCPLCKVQMKHPLLKSVMSTHMELFEKVRSNAVARLKIDGMLKDDRLVTPGSPYYQNPELYAMHSFAYYVCFKCKQAYFGGRRNCEQNQVENRDPAEMVCFDCGDVPKVECKSSKAHAEFHEWKCRYCCSIAVWFCWGSHHFCEPCHQKAYELKEKDKKKNSSFPKCPGKETCPLRTEHPPAGTEFSLGCGVCNNDAESKKGGKKIDAKDKDKDEADDGMVQGLANAAVGAVEAVKQAVRRSVRNKK